MTSLDLSEYLNPLPERPMVIETLTRQIISLILQAGLCAGDKLPSEKEMMARTNAGRSSVREALRALKTMGIIETRPGAGSFLRQLEPATFIRPEIISIVLKSEGIGDILEARKVLECYTARLAAGRSRDELAELETSMNNMRARVHAGREMYEATWAFHMAIADIAGNPVLAKLVRILYEMVSEIQLEVYWPNVDCQEELENHERLYKAILKGETEAELAMREHVDRVRCVVERAIEHGGGLGRNS